MPSARHIWFRFVVSSLADRTIEVGEQIYRVSLHTRMHARSPRAYIFHSALFALGDSKSVATINFYDPAEGKSQLEKRRSCRSSVSLLAYAKSRLSRLRDIAVTVVRSLPISQITRNPHRMSINSMITAIHVAGRVPGRTQSVDRTFFRMSGTRVPEERKVSRGPLTELISLPRSAAEFVR